MSPFQAYLLYSSIHAHFTTKYDYFKYGGKMKLSRESFEKRNDKYVYNKLANHKDPLNYVVQGHVCCDIKWVGDLFESECEQAYTQYSSYSKATTYLYKQELSRALDSVQGELNKLLSPKSSPPPLLALLVRKQVKYETFIIINDSLRVIDVWDKHLEGDILWTKVRSKVLKYKPFFNFDSEKLKLITREVCLNKRQED